MDSDCKKKHKCYLAFRFIILLAKRIIETIDKKENLDYIEYFGSPLLLSMFILTFNFHPERHTSFEILKSMMSEPESRREWILKLFSEAASTHKRNENYQVWTCPVIKHIWILTNIK